MGNEQCRDKGLSLGELVYAEIYSNRSAAMFYCNPKVYTKYIVPSGFASRNFRFGFCT